MRSDKGTILCAPPIVASLRWLLEAEFETDSHHAPLFLLAIWDDA
jgi:hypothetical protein